MNLIKAKRLRKYKSWKTKHYPRFKRILGKYVKNSKKHLDFGCGFGCFAYLLARDNPKIQIYGIDIPKKIKLGKQKYKRKNLHLITGKIPKKLDSITTFHTLHHLKALNKTIKQLYNHLNKNGKIIIAEFKKTSKQKYKKVYKRQIQEREKFKIPFEETLEQSYKLHNRWTISQFTKLMKKHKFKKIKTKQLDEFTFLYIGEK